jgi:hypothetical protein
MWNDIGREPPRATVVDVARWLEAAAESVEGIDQWLAKMFARDPILLNHIGGPAGPVYQAGNGIHRVHAARIWGLPYVLAIVQVEKLPTPIGPGLGRGPVTAVGGVAATGADRGRWFKLGHAEEPPDRSIGISLGCEDHAHDVGAPRLRPAVMGTVTKARLGEGGIPVFGRSDGIRGAARACRC